MKRYTRFKVIQNQHLFEIYAFIPKNGGLLYSVLLDIVTSKARAESIKEHWYACYSGGLLAKDAVIPKFTYGNTVTFKGIENKLHKYNNDYLQLIGQTGFVVSFETIGKVTIYCVSFSTCSYAGTESEPDQPSFIFRVFEDELEKA